MSTPLLLSSSCIPSTPLPPEPTRCTRRNLVADTAQLVVALPTRGRPGPAGPPWTHVWFRRWLLSCRRPRLSGNCRWISCVDSTLLPLKVDTVPAPVVGSLRLVVPACLSRLLPLITRCPVTNGRSGGLMIGRYGVPPSAAGGVPRCPATSRAWRFSGDWAGGPLTGRPCFRTRGSNRLRQAGTTRRREPTTGAGTVSTLKGRRAL